jgi:hypothetical protein
VKDVDSISLAWWVEVASIVHPPGEVVVSAPGGDAGFRFRSLGGTAGKYLPARKARVTFCLGK